MAALPKIWFVPSMVEFADSILAAIVAVMTLVLMQQQWRRRLLLVVVLLMLGHLKWHTYLPVELTLTTLTLMVLEVNRRHLMADSLLAIQFVNDDLNHLYD